MAFYDHSQWSGAAPGQTPRQPSWEQPPPPSRSGTSSVGAREEPNAFVFQFTEVDRAIDNLVKSGKLPFGAGAGASAHGGPHRQNQANDYEGMRPQSGSGLQNYYQNQRYGPRPEQNQMEQAKRRMAAQRERELRNYHQEQQYAKNVQGPKSDRSMSPNTGMAEDERRELIARQHRALYGNDSSMYTEKNARSGSQDARNASGPRGGSPLAFDPYSRQNQAGSTEPSVQMPPRDHKVDAGANQSRADNTSSPSSNQNPTFGKFDGTQQANRTSNSSPSGGSPPNGGSKNVGGGVAPIGTRPSGSQGQNQGVQKRSTTPLPSPLTKGFNANDPQYDERSTSATSNPSSDKGNVGGLGWGNNSGVWGNPKNSLQASVWG